jgi:site-specific DNA-methyltransferase (adenine-specific)
MGGMKPYYANEHVTLWHGDCREVTEWLAADVLVTDPPYGIAFKRGKGFSRWDHGAQSIAGDTTTDSRDAALVAWGERPAAVFGSFYAAPPIGIRHVLVYRKPVDTGVVGSLLGWRRDVEPVYLVGQWPRRPAVRSSLLVTGARSSGNRHSGIAGRYGHPHAKPVDLLEALIDQCPPGVIADPFAGSGSTLVAARNLGRQAIGVEIEERYCELIARRLAQDVLPIGGAA